MIGRTYVSFCAYQGTVINRGFVLCSYSENVEINLLTTQDTEHPCFKSAFAISLSLTNQFKQASYLGRLYLMLQE